MLDANPLTQTHTMATTRQRVDKDTFKQIFRDHWEPFQQHAENMQRFDRLLEAARPATAPPTSRVSPALPQRERSNMRQRIVALLHDYPEGLSPAQSRQLLGVDKDLGSTMKAMVRDGLLRRLGAGRYVAL